MDGWALTDGWMHLIIKIPIFAKKPLQ